MPEHQCPGVRREVRLVGRKQHADLPQSLEAAAIREGFLDSVRGEAESANAAAEAAISEAELGEMRQTVALFQLWEHVARARLQELHAAHHPRG